MPAVKVAGSASIAVFFDNSHIEPMVMSTMMLPKIGMMISTNCIALLLD